MSESQRIPFPTTALQPEAPGIASRAVEVNGVRWAVVEYQPGVLREEWCENGTPGTCSRERSNMSLSKATALRWLHVRARGSRCRRAAATVAAPARRERGFFSSIVPGSNERERD